MPTFCRHNRLAQNCPICREPEPAAARPARGPRPAGSRRGRSADRAREMAIRRAPRVADDGYRSDLVPGVKLSEDARRLADEVAFAAGRLLELAAAPPGTYAEVAREADLEEATWLAFLLAYLGPLEGAEPFAGVAAARTSWSSAALPSLDGVPLGPRSSHDPARGATTIAAYRAWAARHGSQAAALTGDPAWSAQRRFERIFERLALPGLSRAARYDLLVVLGRLGRYDLAPASLQLAGGDEVSLAAKRVFGIGDPLLLERRARALADACDVPLGALDLALFNWQRDEPRATMGASPAALEAATRERVAGTLGL